MKAELLKSITEDAVRLHDEVQLRKEQLERLKQVQAKLYEDMMLSFGEQSSLLERLFGARLPPAPSSTID